ncbi:hypothetical protein HK097_000313, partial [Rhizophlyctis rosea]
MDTKTLTLVGMKHASTLLPSQRLATLLIPVRPYSQRATAADAAERTSEAGTSSTEDAAAGHQE